MDRDGSPCRGDATIAQVVTIAGVVRKDDRVIVYRGYTKLPEALVADALGSGEFSKAPALPAATIDIALIRLASPVTDVTPMRLYRGNAEVGKTVQILGKRATGNGADGQVPSGAHRTVLRRAFNAVAGARQVWYRFDPPPSGLPLESIAGGGNSGSPAIIEHEGLQQLVGLSSWNKYRPSGDHAFHPGLYGQIVYNVRISRYIQWIESVMSASKPCYALQRTQLPCADRHHL